LKQAFHVFQIATRGDFYVPYHSASMDFNVTPGLLLGDEGRG
jgi:hypothetical protein